MRSLFQIWLKIAEIGIPGFFEHVTAEVRRVDLFPWVVSVIFWQNRAMSTKNAHRFIFFFGIHYRNNSKKEVHPSDFRGHMLKKSRNADFGDFWSKLKEGSHRLMLISVNLHHNSRAEKHQSIWFNVRHRNKRPRSLRQLCDFWAFFVKKLIIFAYFCCFLKVLNRFLCLSCEFAPQKYIMDFFGPRRDGRHDFFKNKFLWRRYVQGCMKV